jgi:hypothetical protein
MNQRKKTLKNNGGSQQINGRERQTATFIKRFFLIPTLRVASLPPRHLNRWAFPVKTRNVKSLV